MCSLLALTEWKMSVLCSEQQVTRGVCSDTHLSAHTHTLMYREHVYRHVMTKLHEERHGDDAHFFCVVMARHLFQQVCNQVR